MTRLPFGWRQPSLPSTAAVGGAGVAAERQKRAVEARDRLLLYHSEGPVSLKAAAQTPPPAPAADSAQPAASPRRRVFALGEESAFSRPAPAQKRRRRESAPGSPSHLIELSAEADPRANRRGLSAWEPRSFAEHIAAARAASAAAVWQEEEEEDPGNQPLGRVWTSADSREAKLLRGLPHTLVRRAQHGSPLRGESWPERDPVRGSGHTVEALVASRRADELPEKLARDLFPKSRPLLDPPFPPDPFATARAEAVRQERIRERSAEARREVPAIRRPPEDPPPEPPPQGPRVPPGAAGYALSRRQLTVHGTAAMVVPVNGAEADRLRDMLQASPTWERATQGSDRREARRPRAIHEKAASSVASLCEWGDDDAQDSMLPATTADAGAGARPGRIAQVPSQRAARQQEFVPDFSGIEFYGVPSRRPAPPTAPPAPAVTEAAEAGEAEGKAAAAARKPPLAAAPPPSAAAIAAAAPAAEPPPPGPGVDFEPEQYAHRQRYPPSQEPRTWRRPASAGSDHGASQRRIAATPSGLDCMVQANGAGTAQVPQPAEAAPPAPAAGPPSVAPTRATGSSPTPPNSPPIAVNAVRQPTQLAIGGSTPAEPPLQLPRARASLRARRAVQQPLHVLVRGVDPAATAAAIAASAASAAPVARAVQPPAPAAPPPAAATVTQLVPPPITRISTPEPTQLGPARLHSPEPAPGGGALSPLSNPPAGWTPRGSPSSAVQGRPQLAPRSPPPPLSSPHSGVAPLDAAPKAARAREAAAIMLSAVLPSEEIASLLSSDTPPREGPTPALSPFSSPFSGALSPSPKGPGGLPLALSPSAAAARLARRRGDPPRRAAALCAAATAAVAAAAAAARGAADAAQGAGQAAPAPPLQERGASPQPAASPRAPPWGGPQDSPRRALPRPASASRRRSGGSSGGEGAAPRIAPSPPRPGSAGSRRSSSGAAANGAPRPALGPIASGEELAAALLTPVHADQELSTPDSVSLDPLTAGGAAGQARPRRSPGGRALGFLQNTGSFRLPGWQGSTTPPAAAAGHRSLAAALSNQMRRAWSLALAAAAGGALSTAAVAAISRLLLVRLPQAEARRSESLGSSSARSADSAPAPASVQRRGEGLRRTATQPAPAMLRSRRRGPHRKPAAAAAVAAGCGAAAVAVCEAALPLAGRWSGVGIAARGWYALATPANDALSGPTRMLSAGRLLSGAGRLFSAASSVVRERTDSEQRRRVTVADLQLNKQAEETPEQQTRRRVSMHTAGLRVANALRLLRCNSMPTLAPGHAFEAAQRQVDAEVRAQRGAQWAVVVAVGIYDDRRLLPCHQTVSDAQDLAFTLRYAGYNVAELHDSAHPPTVRNITSALLTARAACPNPADVCVFIFLGLGHYTTGLGTDRARSDREGELSEPDLHLFTREFNPGRVDSGAAGVIRAQADLCAPAPDGRPLGMPIIMCDTVSCYGALRRRPQMPGPTGGYVFIGGRKEGVGGELHCRTRAKHQFLAALYWRKALTGHALRDSRITLNGLIVYLDKKLRRFGLQPQTSVIGLQTGAQGDVHLVERYELLRDRKALRDLKEKMKQSPAKITLGCLVSRQKYDVNSAAFNLALDRVIAKLCKARRRASQAAKVAQTLGALRAIEAAQQAQSASPKAVAGARRRSAVPGLAAPASPSRRLSSSAPHSPTSPGKRRASRIGPPPAAAAAGGGEFPRSGSQVPSGPVERQAGQGGADIPVTELSLRVEAAESEGPTSPAAAGPTSPVAVVPPLPLRRGSQAAAPAGPQPVPLLRQVYPYRAVVLHLAEADVEDVVLDRRRGARMRDSQRMVVAAVREAAKDFRINVSFFLRQGGAVAQMHTQHAWALHNLYLRLHEDPPKVKVPAWVSDPFFNPRLLPDWKEDAPAAAVAATLLQSAAPASPRSARKSDAGSLGSPKRKSGLQRASVRCASGAPVLGQSRRGSVGAGTPSGSPTSGRRASVAPAAEPSTTQPPEGFETDTVTGCMLPLRDIPLGGFKVLDAQEYVDLTFGGSEWHHQKLDRAFRSGELSDVLQPFSLRLVKLSSKELLVEAAAVRLQAAMRGWLFRKTWKVLRAVDLEEEADRARIVVEKYEASVEQWHWVRAACRETQLRCEDEQRADKMLWEREDRGFIYERALRQQARLHQAAAARTACAEQLPRWELSESQARMNIEVSYALCMRRYAKISRLSNEWFLGRQKIMKETDLGMKRIKWDWGSIAGP